MNPCNRSTESKATNGKYMKQQNRVENIKTGHTAKRENDAKMSVSTKSARGVSQQRSSNPASVVKKLVSHQLLS